MRLEGERLRLRAMEKEDIDLFLKWFNDPDICRFLLRHRPLGRKEEEEFLENLHKRDKDILYVIEDRKENRPIGSCGLHRIALPDRNAELGIVLGEKEYWNRGYGREAMNLLCGYGFNVLNLHRIGLCVKAFNERGVRCYEKVGFQMEGRAREAVFYNGKYWDLLAMGMLAREWRERNPDAGAPANGRSLCQAE